MGLGCWAWVLDFGRGVLHSERGDQGVGFGDRLYWLSIHQYIHCYITYRHAYIHKHMHDACMHTLLLACILICTCIFIRINIHIRVRLHVLRVHLHSYIIMRPHACTPTYLRIYTPTQLHTHTDTHTHTLADRQAGRQTDRQTDFHTCMCTCLLNFCLIYMHTHVRPYSWLNCTNMEPPCTPQPSGRQPEARKLQRQINAKL